MGDKMEQFSYPPVYKKILKALLETRIMLCVRDEPLSGYDFLLHFNEKFNINLSPGTIYSTINNMERDGLIKSEIFMRKRIYRLTTKGKSLLDETLENQESLHDFVQELLVI